MFKAAINVVNENSYTIHSHQFKEKKLEQMCPQM